MRRSRFVITYENVQPGEHVLYNVLSDCYAGIDDATLNAIGGWERGIEPVDDEVETAEALRSGTFLIGERSEDDEALRQHLERAAEGMPGTMRITLTPTLVCDIACHYCFQKESPAFTTMTPEMERASVEWILRQVDGAGSRTLLVHYTGGEPLTRKDFLLRTAEILSASMAARGGTFEWRITTNGVRLDRAFVTSMNRFGQGLVKVTLDGDKETHDQARVYRDGRGTFDRIYANLLDCAGLVKILIGGNFVGDDADSYERLMERMDRTGLSSHVAGVQFKAVIDTSREDSAGCTNCHTPKEKTETLVQINRSVDQRRLGVVAKQTLESMLGPCELHWTHNYVIDPDGYVYKCPAVAGRREVATGHVSGDGAQKTAPLLELRPWEKCGDCAYLPVCVGGCLGSVYLKTGRRDEVHCQFDDFEASFRETIPQRYLAELGEEAWQVAGVS